MDAEIERNWTVIKAAYPGAVVFHEVDDLYFVKGADAELVAREFRIRTAANWLGFDRPVSHLYMRELAKRGHTVVRTSNGQVVRVPTSPTARRSTAHRRAEGKFLAIEPTLMFDAAELACPTALARNGQADLFAMLRLAFLTEDHRVLRDYGEVYVVEAGEWYDIDREFTLMPYSRVLLLARAAAATGKKLPCRLVPPKFRRHRRGARAVDAAREPTGLPLGQMGFELLVGEWRAD